MNKIVTLFLILTIMSCGTKRKSNKTSEDSLYGKWQLTVLNGENISKTFDVHIELKKDNQVNGFLGCNRLLGGYTTKDGKIIFTQLGATRMACPDAEMKLEAEVLEMLNTINTFTFENNKLTFSIDGKKTLAVFVPI